MDVPTLGPRARPWRHWRKFHWIAGLHQKTGVSLTCSPVHMSGPAFHIIDAGLDMRTGDTVRRAPVHTHGPACAQQYVSPSMQTGADLTKSPV